MATKFSNFFAISMLKKHGKFCRRGLTNLDATPTFQKTSKYLWDFDGTKLKILSEIIPPFALYQYKLWVLHKIDLLSEKAIFSV